VLLTLGWPLAVPVLLAYFEAPQLRCVFANQRFVQALGLPATSILGQTARQLAGPRLWAVIEPNTQKTLAGHTAQYTREHRMPNGELLQLEVSLVPHFAPAGAGQAAPVVQGLFMLGNDVSHHLRAEQAIRASDERMQKFSAATKEGIAFHTDGIITDCNEALLRLTGYPREQVLGRAMLDFIQPADHPRVRHYMEQRLESLYEVGVLHQDGHVLPLEVMGKTMPQVAGGYRVVVVRDTTQRRQAQQRALAAIKFSHFSLFSRSCARATIKAKPSRFWPRHLRGCSASGLAAPMPMPQIRSRGLASTSTRSPVAKRKSRMAGF
jgi:PAS domain S-box-containing protein